MNDKIDKWVGLVMIMFLMSATIFMAAVTIAIILGED